MSENVKDILSNTYFCITGFKIINAILEILYNKKKHKIEK